MSLHLGNIVVNPQYLRRAITLVSTDLNHCYGFQDEKLTQAGILDLNTGVWTRTTVTNEHLGLMAGDPPMMTVGGEIEDGRVTAIRRVPLDHYDNRWLRPHIKRRLPMLNRDLIPVVRALADHQVDGKQLLQGLKRQFNLDGVKIESNFLGGWIITDTTHNMRHDVEWLLSKCLSQRSSSSGE